VVHLEEFSHLTTDGPWGIVDLNNNLLAMYEKFKNETLKPAVVLSQEH
jgi:hypothetical protein